MNVYEVKTKRVMYIDIAKSIAIFLVVLGHVVPRGYIVKEAIYSFHMPLFFLLSGFCFSINKQLKKRDFWEFVAKKFKVIIVPYILWGLIYTSFSLRNIVLLCYGTRQSLISSGTLSSLWFLPVLFFSNIVMFCVCWVLNKIGFHWFVKLLFAILLWYVGVAFNFVNFKGFGFPLSINVAFCATSFMIIGNVLKKVSLNKDWIKLIVICIFTLIWFVCFKVNVIPYGYMLMAENIYGVQLLSFVCSLAGGGGILVFSYLLSNGHLCSKIFSRIGQMTFGIFVIHKPIIVFVQHWFKNSCDISPILYSVIVAIMVFIISILFVFVFEKVMPFMVGKTNR